MPTISQLPPTTTVTAADALPISQGGATRSVSLGSLLSQTQPAILIASQSLLGRTSLGSGGPEAVAIGTGLTLTSGTLVASGLDVSTMPRDQTISETDHVLLEHNGYAGLVPVSALRSLFTAGTHVSIDADGVISINGITIPGTTGFASIGGLPLAATMSAQDVIAIAQNGTDRAISYADFLNGQTIDAANPAAAASDSDTFWVAQGTSTMARQSLSAIWNWVSAKLPTNKAPVVEISVDTFFDTTIHNGRILVCSQPITFSALLANMGIGFHCEIINLSGGNVMLSADILTSSGSSTLSAGQAALIRCIAYANRTSVYALVSGSSTLAIPGAVTRLSVSTVTSSSITLNWQVPATGATPANYIVQSRPTGSTDWNLVGQSIVGTSFTITGLPSSTSYDVTVAAVNAAGTGANSAALTISTAAILSVPNQVTSVTAAASSSNSLAVTWLTPASGPAPTAYTVQYRLAGTLSWSGNIADITTTSQLVGGLLPGTSYDIIVTATNSAGASSDSAVATASTFQQTGSVASINWNVAAFGTYTHGNGAIGLNAHVNPATAPIQFGFSNSLTTPPSSWTAAVLVNTDLWGAYVPAPATAGQWYSWVEGIDGSCPTVYSTAFTVT